MVIKRTQSSRILLLRLFFELLKHVASKVPVTRSLIPLSIRSVLWKVLKVRRFDVALARVCRHPTRRHPNVSSATAHLTRRDRLLVPLPRPPSRHRYHQLVPTAGFTPRIVHLSRVANATRVKFLLLCGLAPRLLKRRPTRRSRRVHVVRDRQSQRRISRVVLVLRRRRVRHERRASMRASVIRRSRRNREVPITMTSPRDRARTRRTPTDADGRNH